MKNILTITILFIAGYLIGQSSFTIPYKGQSILIENVNGVEVYGYDGNEIVLTTDNDYDHDDNERAAGLRRISGNGATDNTGLGISVKEKGETIEIKQARGAFDCVDLVIKIPKKAYLKYENSNITACDLIVENYDGELEISKNFEDVELVHITGPVVAKVIYGDIEASFTTVSQIGSVSLHSTYGDVEIKVPPSTKSNLDLKTLYGDVYTDFDIKIKENLSSDNEDDDDEENSLFCMPQFGSHILGSINNGGVDMFLNATYGDIYLRSK